MARIRNHDDRNDWLRRVVKAGVLVIVVAIIVALLLYRSAGGPRAAGWVMAIAFFGWCAWVAVDAIIEFKSDYDEDKAHSANDVDLGSHPALEDSDALIAQEREKQANEERRRREVVRRELAYRKYRKGEEGADSMPYPNPEDVTLPKSLGESNL